MNEVISKTGFPRAGFRRRLAAMVYDLLVTAAIALAAALIGLLILQLFITVGVFSLGNHDEISTWLQATAFGHLIFQAYLLFCITYFYIWFWSKGGQTVGMKTWRLRVQNENGHDISKKQALIRLVCSVFGLGNLWLLLARRYRLSLQDYAAKCEVVVLTKEANQHKNWQKLY
ncbi:RDD family protein [Algibacillus agarilyticus]|uniref:RDD family protein n=1 Tax=Algibacillus agarilyticus TaxID=2234133 RepID=UPI000DCFE9C2|nr:RDD family protein [Algibacillus agarilyticus]